jgi:hypothetical protein
LGDTYERVTNFKDVESQVSNYYSTPTLVWPAYNIPADSGSWAPWLRPGISPAPGWEARRVPQKKGEVFCWERYRGYQLYRGCGRIDIPNCPNNHRPHYYPGVTSKDGNNSGTPE